MEELEAHERVGQVSEELLEQRRKLHRVVVAEIDGSGVTVKSLGELLQPADVAVLAEDALDRHVCDKGSRVSFLPLTEK